MATQLPTAESIDLSSWKINKEAFAPPTTRRTIRGWDRAAVSAHAPRRLRRKVWKPVILKHPQVKSNEDEAQEELQKDGVGARKKPRKTRVKENIGNPSWDVSSAGPDQEITDYFEAKRNDGQSLAEVMEDDAITIPQEDPDILKLRSIPRKRTNTAHVITPRKSLRRTALAPQAQQELFTSHTVDNLNSPQQQRKSSGKSIGQSTGSKNSPKLQGARENSWLLDNSDQKEDDNAAPFNELEIDGSVAGARSPQNGTNDFPVIKDSPNTILTTLDETLAETSPPVTIRLANEGHSMNSLSAEFSYIDHHEAIVAASDSEVIGACEELNTDCTVSDPRKETEPVEIKSPSHSSILGSDLVAKKNVQEVCIEKVNGSPGTMTRTYELRGFAKSSTALDMGEQVEFTSYGDNLLEDRSEETNDDELLGGFETMADVDASYSSAEKSDLTKVTTSQSGANRTSDMMEVLVFESQARNTEHTETLALKTSRTADAPANIMLTTYGDDHEDTDMLRNFMTRVKANKAAKTPARRKRVLPRSPLRMPLGEMNSNISSSPGRRLADEPDLAEMSREVLALGTENEPESRRRSRRAQLPTKAARSGPSPSFIPIRRLDQDVEAPVAAKRNEEKEIAALTRFNTRKNKGAALTVAKVLAKRAEQKGDPAVRQRLLKEAFDEKIAKDRRDDGRKGKTVTWAAELAQFQTQADQAGAKTEAAEEDKKQGAVRVGIRSKMALGMAVNGTPTPKRKMRGRA